MTRQVPTLAITTGEPAGIGPDLIIELAARKQTYQEDACLVVIANKKMLQERAAILGIDIEAVDYNKSNPAKPNKVNEIIVMDMPCNGNIQAGCLNKENSQYVLNTLNKATEGTLNKEFDAIVTAPLHKGIINDAGIKFTGHTEYLAALTKAKLPVMMLAAKNLRVALATTHLPLKEVSDNITQESLRDVISILHKDLQHKFGIPNPHILICGLNPHAGEGGHLGMEEINVIEPIISDLKGEGLNLSGPLPADTLFTPKYLKDADAVLAMYHDQGLPVLKNNGFGHSVNITLGLPIIRTSVDHGTALDLAGTGNASTTSMVAAIETAIQMTNKRVN